MQVINMLQMNWTSIFIGIACEITLTATYLEITASNNSQLVGKIILEDKAIANFKERPTINL